jgi:putative tryptophan/tyrosine transport system substrate-binding protein
VRRREFIGGLIGGAIAPWPLITQAQEMGRSYRVGSLHLAKWDTPHHVAFRDALRRLGFIEGHNLSIDRDGHGMGREQFPGHAARLVELNVDVIHCSGDAGIQAAQQATAVIPILGLTDDMVGAGLVRSLAHPGGNTTGISILASELDSKRQELLLELIPTARRIATLADSGTTAPSQLKTLQQAGATRGVEVAVHQVGKREQIAAAVDAAKAAGAQALNVLATPLFFNNRHIIFERTTTLKLPAIYQWPEMARDAGLIAYGPSIVRIYRQQMAPMLAKLLLGAKAADLAVEQPTDFELVINLKIAKALGLTVPPTLFARADEVIE